MNYPLGAGDDPRAPWNKSTPSPIDIDVTASNTLSKSAQVSVDDYTYKGCDEDGSPCFDCRTCNLTEAWQKQNYTVKEALTLAIEFAKEIYVLKPEQLQSELKQLKERAAKVFNACEGWEEDEFEVVLD